MARFATHSGRSLTVLLALAVLSAPSLGADVAAKPQPQDAPPALSAAAQAWLAARPSVAATPPTLTPAALDDLVDHYLKDAKAPAAAVTTDAAFARRAYLDLTGKPPTVAQTVAFVDDRSAGKRARLIDRLLESPDFAANWARYWTDVVRYHATNPNANRAGVPELEAWLKAQIAANRPWDAVARDLIAATGRADENGAVGFTLAHDGQAVEVAGEVSRVFLGVQIQCAQCHDHPTDAWKREQFHEFAAFFAGARVRRASKAMERPVVFEVVAPGKPRYTMPDLKDPAKALPVAPRFFLNSAGGATAEPVPPGLTAAERRRLAASYVTGPDNPWFARAYVNRVWQALLGEGFYSPVDDLGPGREAKAPQVLDALAAQWRDGGHDARWLFRTVMNSRAYQRESRASDSAAGQTAFASNVASRLRADQIYDALVQVLDLTAPVNRPGPAAALAKAKAKGQGKGGRGFTPRAAFNGVFGVDPSTPSEEVLGTIPQALFLMNGPALQRAIEARPGTVLGGLLASQPDDRAALEALYLRVLDRSPTPQEVRTCGDYLARVGDRREAFEDVLWGLVNSTEFLSRR